MLFVISGVRFNSGSRKSTTKCPSWKKTDSQTETITHSTTLSTSIPSSEKEVDRFSVERNRSFNVTTKINQADKTKYPMRSSKSYHCEITSNPHDLPKLNFESALGDDEENDNNSRVSVSATCGSENMGGCTEQEAEIELAETHFEKILIHSEHNLGSLEKRRNEFQDSTSTKDDQNASAFGLKE